MRAAPARRDTIRGLAPALAGAIVAGLGAIAAYALTTMSGTKTGLVLAAGAIAGPILTYAAIVAPIAFPFSVYIALVPFDNILDIGSFGTLTKLLAIVSGAFLALFLLRTRRAQRPSGALLVWIGLYLWMAATGFWALDPNSVFSLLPTALELLALYVAVSLYPSDLSAVRWAIGATLAGGAFAAAYGIYLFQTGASIGQEDRLWITVGDSFIDPNHFAAALLLPAALALTLAAYARRAPVAIACIAALVVLLYAMDLSASRGAMLGVAAIAVYLLVRSRRRLQVAMLTVLPTLALLVVQSSLLQRFATAFSSDGAGRVDIWKVGAIALRSNWLLGAGYNNFAFAYDRAFLQVHQMQFSSWHRAPHNLLLGAAVELGIPGLLVLLAAWVAQFRMLRDVPADSPEYPARLALEATLVGTFVAAMFLDIMVQKYLWLTFMLIAILRNFCVRRSSRAPYVSPLFAAGSGRRRDPGGRRIPA